jgi:hypothetical protein
MTVIARSDLAAAIMLITLWFGVVVPAQSAEPPSSAVTETPVTKPDAVALEVWPTVGQARLKILFWNVYDSVLSTPTGTWQDKGPYQLALTYLRDIPAQQLVDETEKAWRDQGRSHPDENQWLQSLLSLWPDVTEGDTLVLVVDAAGNNAFWLNNSALGSIDHLDFAAFFGGIWLDEDSPRPALRAKLVGQ